MEDIIAWRSLDNPELAWSFQHMTIPSWNLKWLLALTGNRIQTLYSNLQNPTSSGPYHLSSLISLFPPLWLPSLLDFLFLELQELVRSLGPLQEFTPWVPSAWNACLRSSNPNKFFVLMAPCCHFDLTINEYHLHGLSLTLQTRSSHPVTII